MSAIRDPETETGTGPGTGNNNKNTDKTTNKMDKPKDNSKVPHPRTQQYLNQLYPLVWQDDKHVLVYFPSAAADSDPWSGKTPPLLGQLRYDTSNNRWFGQVRHWTGYMVNVGYFDRPEEAFPDLISKALQDG